MILYHASRNKFEHFDIDYAGSIESHAKNSQLGLWFAPGHEDSVVSQFEINHTECSG